MIKVLLRGGPAGLPGSWYVEATPAFEDNLKIPWLNGREHFIHLGEYEQIDSVRIAVYRWNRSTKIAE